MEESNLNLQEALHVLKKRKRLIFGCFFYTAVLTMLVSLLWSPTYEGESALRIKQSRGLNNSLLGDMVGTNSYSTKQLMSTYAEIIKSRTVVQGVIDEVYADKEKSKIPNYKNMVGRITTQPVKDTEILKVKVTASGADEAALVTNKLVDAFINRLTELVRTEQRTTRGFIGERLSNSRNELDKAEAALEEYKRQQKILTQEDETKALVERLSYFDKLAADNMVALNMAQARLATADAQLEGQDPGFVADNQTIQQYKTLIVEQEVKLVDLLQHYTDKHPQVVSTRKKIAELRASLSEEVIKAAGVRAPTTNKVFEGLLTSRIQTEVDVAAAQAQQVAIKKVLADSDKEMANLPAKERGLVRLLRDVNVAQEIYIMLAKRHEEARIAEVMESTDTQVVDVAVVPDRPIRPRVLFNTLIGALAGLFAGLGMAFVLECLNRNIKNAEDVEAYLKLPVLGNIPDFNGRVDAKLAWWKALKKWLMKKETH